MPIVNAFLIMNVILSRISVAEYDEAVNSYAIVTNVKPNVKVKTVKPCQTAILAPLSVCLCLTHGPNESRYFVYLGTLYLHMSRCTGSAGFKIYPLFLLGFTSLKIY
ncbi:unnamed protein product [Tenebrio molitor]|nr:unnamed protein product [Tenebrio molitor]